MSASREKKSRSDDQDLSMKSARTRKEIEAEQKKQKQYTIFSILLLAVALTAVAWNNGLFETKAAAFTIQGSSYSAAQVQMFYSSEMMSALYGVHQPGEGGTSFDYSLTADQQIYSSDPLTSWHDFFVTTAVNQIAEIHLLYQAAQEEGYQLSQQGQDDLEANLLQLETVWIGQTQDLETYLRYQYGSDMTESAYLDLMNKETVANYYQTDKQEGFEITQAELDSYYSENQDSLDQITKSEIYFSHTLPTVYDTEGVAEEHSQEELDQFALESEELQAQATALQETVEAGLAEGLDLETILEEHHPDGSYSLHDTVLSSTYDVSSDAGAWILSQDREENQVHYYGSGDTTNTNYSVLIYEDRTPADSATATIRHALIAAAESGEVPTDEQYDQAEETAQTLLDQWKADGASEEAFATLAQEHSADSGSASQGGLLENVSDYSGFIQGFTDWTLDPSRATGDTGLVKNEGSSTMGWHMMYFQDWGPAYWETLADTALRAEKLDAFREELFQDMDSLIQRDAGLQNVIPTSLF